MNRTTLLKLIILSLILITGFNIHAGDKIISYSVGEADWPPVIYSDPESESGFNGLFIDILTELFIERLNMPFICKPSAWKRAQRNVEDGRADFLLTVPTEQRLAYAVPSDLPIFQLYMNVFTYKNHEKIDEIRKIKNADDILKLGLIPVTNQGNGWHKANIDSYGIKTHYVRDDLHIVRFLAAKRADIMIDAVVPTNYLIKNLNLESKIELTDVKFGPADFHLLIGNKSPYFYLMPEINKTIKEMKNDGTLDRITEKYSKLD